MANVGGSEHTDGDSVIARVRELVRRAGMLGEPLPGEPSLVASLGISRPALREVLARLESEGLIRRRQGAMTIVNPGALDMVARFDQQVEYSDLLRDAGFEPTLEVLESRPVKVNASDAQALAVPEKTVALRTVKRWCADGKPALVAIDVIPVKDPVSIDLASVDPTEGLFALVKRLRGEIIEWELAWPGASLATTAVRGWLGMKSRTAVLTLDLVGVSRSGVRSYRAGEYHVPGLVRSGFIRSVRL